MLFTLMTPFCKANHLKHARNMFGLQFIFLKNWGLLFSRISTCLFPTQILTFPGFCYHFIRYDFIRLTPEKIEKILHKVRHFLDAEFITIRVVESCIGRLASSFPCVQFGPLYYRNVKICKSKALYRANCDFDAPIALTVKAFSELNWRLDNGQTVPMAIKTPGFGLTVYSDASLEGWVATNLHSVGGR